MQVMTCMKPSTAARHLDRLNNETRRYIPVFNPDKKRGQRELLVSDPVRAIMLRTLEQPESGLNSQFSMS